MAALSRMFPWGISLLNVKPDTLIRWQRKTFRLFWRWKSEPAGRPRLPKDFRQLIRQMAAENPTWGEERIANELKRKLGIRVSPPYGGEVSAPRPGAHTRSQAALADLGP
jgi:putative transposase